MNITFPVAELNGSTILCVVNNGVVQFKNSNSKFEKAVKDSNIAEKLKPSLMCSRMDTEERILYLRGTCIYGERMTKGLTAFTTWGRAFEISAVGAVKNLSVDIENAVPKDIQRLSRCITSTVDSEGILCVGKESSKTTLSNFNLLSTTQCRKDELKDYLYVLIDEFTGYPTLVYFEETTFRLIPIMATDMEVVMRELLRGLVNHTKSLSDLYDSYVELEEVVYPVFDDSRLDALLDCIGVIKGVFPSIFYAFVCCWVESKDRKVSFPCSYFSVEGLEDTKGMQYFDFGEALTFYNQEISSYPMLDKKGNLLGYQIDDGLLGNLSNEDSIMVDISNYKLKTGSLYTTNDGVVYYVRKLGEIEPEAMLGAKWSTQQIFMYLEPMGYDRLYELLSTQLMAKGGGIFVNLEDWHSSGKLVDLAGIVVSKILNANDTDFRRTFTMEFVVDKLKENCGVWLEQLRPRCVFKIGEGSIVGESAQFQQQTLGTFNDTERETARIHGIWRAFNAEIAMQFIGQAGLLDYSVEDSLMHVTQEIGVKGEHYLEEPERIQVIKDNIKYTLTYAKGNIGIAKINRIAKYLSVLACVEPSYTLGKEAFEEWGLCNAERVRAVMNGLSSDTFEYRLNDCVQRDTKERLVQEIKELVFRLSDSIKKYSV